MTRFETSEDKGVYGTVTGSNNRTIQVLFTDDSGDEADGISVESGGASTFDYFVFVPRDIFATLVSIHTLETVEMALITICDHLLKHNE